MQDWLKKFLPKEIGLKPIDFSDISEGESGRFKLNHGLEESRKVVRWLQKIISNLESKGVPSGQIAIFKEYLRHAKESERHFEKTIEENQIDLFYQKQKKENEEEIKRIQDYYNESIEFSRKTSMIMKEEAMRLMEKLQKYLRELLQQIEVIDKQILINKDKIEINKGKIQSNSRQVTKNTSQIDSNAVKITENDRQIEEREKRLLERGFFERLSQKTGVPVEILQQNSAILTEQAIFSV